MTAVVAGEWTSGELVRAIQSLTRAMEAFEESVGDAFKDIDRKYVPREVYDRDMATRDRDLAAVRELAKAAVPREVYDRDMAAVRDRHTVSSTWVRELTAPLLTALASGVILWLLLGVHR